MSSGGWRRSLLSVAALAFPRRLRRRHGRDLVRLAEDLARGQGRGTLGSAFEIAREGLAARFAGESAPLVTGPPREPGARLDGLLQDLRLAVRAARRSRGFTLVALTILAVGIGANTAIFAVLNALLIQPLAIPDAGRVFQLYGVNLARGIDGSNESLPNIEDLAARVDAVEAWGAITFVDRNLSAAEFPERVTAAAATSGMYGVLAMRPLMGALPAAAHEIPGAERVVLLTESYWRSRLGSDPDVVGASLRLEGEPHTVLGVVTDLPVARVDLVQPLVRDEAVRARSNRFLTGFLRLRPDREGAMVREQLDLAAARLGAEHPENDGGWGVRIEPLRAALVGSDWRPFALLLGVVGSVLLIACVNVANLLLVRASDRRVEVAVRAALGADRARLARQLLIESLLLAAMSGAIGTLLAAAGVGLLRARLPPAAPGIGAVTLDGTVLGFALALSGVTGVTFGLLPALHAARTDLRATLGSDSARGGTAPGVGRLRDALVVLQVSIAVALLGVAGLLVSGLWRVLGTELGFDPSGVVVMRLEPPAGRYPAGELLPFVDELVRGAGGIPGVAAVAVTTQIPMDSSRTARGVKPREAPDPTFEEALWAGWVAATPGYAETVGMELVAGRSFRESDDSGAPPVAIVNRTLARRLFGTDEVVGRAFHAWTDEPEPRTIVGVIADVVDRPLSAQPGPQYLTPLAQTPRTRLNLVVRATGDDASGIGPIRDLLRRLDPDLPMFDVQALDRVVGARTAQLATLSWSLSALAVLAVALAALGLYGVVAYTVSRRTREIGIHMALGADAGRVRRMVVRRSLALTATGLAVGVGFSWLARELLGEALPVAAAIPWSAVVAVMMLAAALASWLPMRRATRVDPLTALRAE